MTGTVTQTAGGTFSSTADPFTYTMAAVVKGSPIAGPAQGVGLAGSNGNALVSATGTLSFDLNGVGTHTMNGTWISPDSRGTLTGVTMTQTPGTYFEQTTTTTANISPPTTPAPYTQTTTLSGPVAGSIISTTNIVNSFPAPGPTSPTINVQGVTAPGGWAT